MDLGSQHRTSRQTPEAHPESPIVQLQASNRPNTARLNPNTSRLNPNTSRLTPASLTGPPLPRAQATPASVERRSNPNRQRPSRIACNSFETRRIEVKRHAIESKSETICRDRAAIGPIEAAVATAWATNCPIQPAIGVTRPAIDPSRAASEPKWSNVGPSEAKIGLAEPMNCLKWANTGLADPNRG